MQRQTGFDMAELNAILGKTPLSLGLCFLPEASPVVVEIGLTKMGMDGNSINSMKNNVIRNTI